MAWSAQLSKAEVAGGNVVATVIFTNGLDSLEERVPGNDLTPERLAEFVKRRIVGLEARDAALIDLKLGEGQPITPKDQDIDADRVQFRKNWSRLLSLTRLSPKSQKLIDEAAALRTAVEAYCEADATALDDPFLNRG